MQEEVLHATVQLDASSHVLGSFCDVMMPFTQASARSPAGPRSLPRTCAGRERTGLARSGLSCQASGGEAPADSHAAVPLQPVWAEWNGRGVGTHARTVAGC